MSTATAAININGAGLITDRAGVAAGLACERIGTGIYEITGALGMAAEGWRTSIPRDDDGQRLISVDIVDSEGTTTVTCTASGLSADIPIGRVLSIRVDVEIPELIDEPEPLE